MSADILIIDDEDDIRSLIEGILQDEGYETRQANNDKSAYKAMTEKKPDLVILDIWLHNSDDDGLAILENIKQDFPYMPVLMISGHGTIETAVSAIKIGAYDFIEKPFKSDRLLLMIERALEASRLKVENDSLKRKQQENSDHFIGKSQKIEAIRQTAQKVAATNSRILIKGQPGTGKEVLARYIHSISDRSKQPFHAINCAILRPETLEVELFGQEKDPAQGKIIHGVLEQVNGGTLLLDEVCDMPLETQGKILRVLQEQVFQRVGSSKEIKVDVRIIASTNRDLAEAIDNGRFRKDLYYRLNVVPMLMPALKEIREDISVLIEYFSKKYANQSGIPEVEISESALNSLKNYEWPGNTRQLKNVIEWLMIMQSSKGSHLVDYTDLPPEFQKSDSVLDIYSHTQTQQTLEHNHFSVPLREAREIFEKDYLEAQVERFSGNISKTAEFVGMERSALHRKLKQLGIQSNPKNHESQNTSKNDTTRKSA